MGLKYIDTKRSALTTTNATISTIVTIPIPTGSVSGTRVEVTVRDSANPLNCGFYLRQVLVANSAGTTSIIGSISTIGVDSVAIGLAGVVLTISVSGGNLMIQGTGLITTTLDWQVITYLNIN